eukprot:4576917-Prymnesium_polylepis.1
MRQTSSRIAHLLRDAPFHAGVCGHGMMLVTEPRDLMVGGAKEESALFCQRCWHFLSFLPISFLPTAPVVYGRQCGLNHSSIGVSSTGVSSTGVSSTGVSSRGPVLKSSTGSTGSTGSHVMAVNRLPNVSDRS